MQNSIYLTEHLKLIHAERVVVEDLGPDCKLLTGVICHFASRIGAMKVL